MARRGALGDVQRTAANERDVGRAVPAERKHSVLHVARDKFGLRASREDESQRNHGAERSH